MPHTSNTSRPSSSQSHTSQNKHWTLSGALATASLALLLSACDSDQQDPPLMPEEEAPANVETQSPNVDESITDNSGEADDVAQFALLERAVAEIAPTENHQAAGTVSFRPTEDETAMLVTLDLTGLEPGQHGFHIHENGDCSAPDASSAGGHFNPYDSSHGGPDDAERHLGDLGNIEASSEGRVKTELRFAGLAFSGPASILQKAVVIHAGADDLSTDPSGNAGARVGCGVIKKQPDILAEPSQ